MNDDSDLPPARSNSYLGPNWTEDEAYRVDDLFRWSGNIPHPASACASPVEGLWHPPPESIQHTVYVSLDTWNALIAFSIQQEDRDQLSAFSSEEGTSSQHSSLRTQHFYEEWGYAERAWYLEGKTDVSGVVRALLWPTRIVLINNHAARYY